MKEELEALIKRIEESTEEPFSPAEIAYLEQVQCLDDLKNHGDSILLKALAYDAALALGATQLQAEMIAGDVPENALVEIELTYQDGEYLMGHTLHGEQAKMLEDLFLARYVDGWGYYVKPDVVEKLGTKFFYGDAWKLARPALEAKKASEAAAKEMTDGIFAEARRTGKPVELRSYMAECDDQYEECDLDHITVFAMPDGSTSKRRAHIW